MLLLANEPRWGLHLHESRGPPEAPKLTLHVGPQWRSSGRLIKGTRMPPSCASSSLGEGDWGEASREGVGSSCVVLLEPED